MEKSSISPAHQFKYRINSILAELPQYAAVKARKNIRERLKVADTTLSRWFNSTRLETQDIPGEALLVISEVLLVPMEDLFTPKK